MIDFIKWNNPYYIWPYNPNNMCNTITSLNFQMQQCNSTTLQQLQEQQANLMCQISQQEQNRFLTEQISQCCCNSKNIATHTEYINQNSRWDSGICFKYLGSPCGIWNENQNLNKPCLYDILFPNDPIKKWREDQEITINEKYKYLEWI